jgi:hypothetical protein
MPGPEARRVALQATATQPLATRFSARVARTEMTGGRSVICIDPNLYLIVWLAGLGLLLLGVAQVIQALTGLFRLAVMAQAAQEITRAIETAWKKYEDSTTVAAEDVEEIDDGDRWKFQGDN